MNGQFLLLFEDCRIVRGFERSIIYDLGRPFNSNFIPESLIVFIESCKTKPISEVMELYSEYDRKIIIEYIDFLIEKEFAFYADKHMKNCMVSLPMNYDTSNNINNAIVCIDQNNLDNLREIHEQLDLLLCINIELRCRNLSKIELVKVITTFENSILEALIIRIDFNIEFDESFVVKLLTDFPRLKHLYIYKSPYKKIESNYSFLNFSVDYLNDCGIISQDNFVINRPFFIESQSCNNCLNKKISIDFDGEIKNCPSMNKTYGNIKNINLKQVVDNNTFKFYWDISKNEIEICQDCEFRYMCLDCRAFIENDKNPLSKPKKCNYNPYLGKWLGEEGFYNINECGVFIDDKFILDKNKIAKLKNHEK